MNRGQKDAVAQGLIEASNVSAMSLLVNSGRVHLEESWLSDAIAAQKFALAAVLEASLLEANDRKLGSVKMCASCKENVAVLKCCYGDECENNSDCPVHCRSCVVKMRFSCRLCYEYCSADCYDTFSSFEARFSRCCICRIRCVGVSTVSSAARQGCVAVACKSCVEPAGQDELLCPDCVNERENESNP